MEIPMEVRIGSMDYKVKMTKENIIVNNVVCYGKIDYENHLIEISSKLGDKQGRERTFLHEIIHGITNDRNINLGTDEENIVDALALGLHQVIRDNPEIFISSYEHLNNNVTVNIEKLIKGEK